MSRFCANCGTEVDETAVFCPTCGQLIDPEVETEMPEAPSWPDPEPDAHPAAPVERGPEVHHEPAPLPDEYSSEEPTRVEHRPQPVASWSEEPPPSEPPPPSETRPPGDARAVDRAGAAPRPAESRPSRPAMALPLTMPVTLSAWLIGGGAALGALGALVALFDGLGTAIDLLLLVALLAIAATVFLVTRVPTIPQLRLVTLAVVLVAFGVALDRLGFGRAGAGELLLFLGTAAAVIGAVLVEIGQDQPLGGPSA